MANDREQQKQWSDEELDKLEKKHAQGSRQGNSSIPEDNEERTGNEKDLSGPAERGQQGRGRVNNPQGGSQDPQDISQIDKQEGQMEHGEKGFD